MLAVDLTSGWFAQKVGSELDHGLFRAHFDGMPGPAYVWQRRADSELVLIAYNRAAAALAADDVDRLLGATATELFVTRPDLKERLDRCATRREMVVEETDIQFPAGAAYRVVITFQPVSTDVVVAHLDDVTERRRAEAAIAASERRFRALFESHPDLVFRMDVAGTYLDVHAADPALLIAPATELIGRNIGEIVGSEAAAHHWHYAREAIRSEEPQVLEYDLELGGRKRHIESRMVKSGPDEVVVLVRDITEDAALEQDLTAVRERERWRVGQALMTQLRQLHDRIDQLGAAVRSLELPGPSSQVLERALGAFDATLRSADEIARDLIPVADGTPIVAALGDLASRTETLHGVTCRLSCGDGVPTMTTQTPDLYRIAQEAVANAVEHGQATWIEIVCGVVNRQFVLNVIDNGEGFRLSAAANAGAGMRIMWHRARRLGGTLTRSRRSNGGTMVTCSCPVG